MDLLDVDNIRKNYEHLLVKLMAGVNRELQVNKQPWLGPELRLILKSLESKLEKKVLNDVQIDFNQMISEGKSVSETGQKECNRGGLTGESAIEKVIKSCLALVKCLQFEGDVEFVNNNFHNRILETIEGNCEKKEEVIHEYSKSLLKIIQGEKNNTTKKQELFA